jgi:uridine kinase
MKLLPLRAGKTARFQYYDWVKDCLSQWVEIEPGGITIVDGVFSLRNELVDSYDLRIWFSCPQEIRISRLLNRGDTPQSEIDDWIPMEERYHAVHKPEKSAHLVIDSHYEANSSNTLTHLKITRWSPPAPKGMNQ